MEILLFSALVLLTLVGIALAALQLPGVWLILASAAGYTWYFGWQPINWKWLVGLAIFAGLAELLDMLAAMTAAKRAGASRRAAVGSLIGGFAGMLLLTPPIPIIGTIAGGLFGCFLGALIGELTVRDDLGASTRVGVFATLGRLIGLILKTGAAVAIGGAVICLAGLALIK